MESTVPLDEVMIQEVLQALSASLASPNPQSNENNYSSPNVDRGEEGETPSEDNIDTITRLMDVLAQAISIETISDGDLQLAERELLDGLPALVLVEQAENLESEFKRTGNVECIEQAIELRSQALSLTPVGDEYMAFHLYGLGQSHHKRFKQLGELADVDKAIEYGTQAVLLTPDGHVLKSFSLDSLGNAHFSRFKRLGDMGDVDRAIESLAQAAQLTPDGHAEKPIGLNNLGFSYQCRFKRLGELADLDQAMKCLTEAVLLMPSDHASKPSLLCNLGNSYQFRFERFRELEDLQRAIEYHTQAALLGQDGHAEIPKLLNNLGNSYLWRFDHCGQVADVDKAIECRNEAVQLSPEGHADKPYLLGRLGYSYRCRFERLGEVPDVDKAIECHVQALLLTPDGHSEKPDQLWYLGISYACRFERLGEVADVDKAIECHTQAVLLTPDGDEDQPGRLDELGSSYLRRFQRLGEIADVDKAIECQSKAVLLTPDGGTGKPGQLNNLGVSHLCRFEHLGKVADVNKAIEYLTRAILLTPDGDAEKPIRLSNLGNACQSRFRLLGEVEDADKGIEYHTQAVLLTPDGHAHNPGLLNNLGLSHEHRFVRHGEVADLDKAIDYHIKAVLLTPDGHASKPTQLNNLGNSCMWRFECTGQSPDLESAKLSFQRAAEHIVINPKIQIRCSRQWAKCCTSLGLSPLPAYERCMELIPRLIWLGTTIIQRYSLLTAISDLTAEAAAWAISIEAHDLAIEWLEQGRSIVWNQILQLRTPFDDLAACNSSLTSRLKSIATELEDAGSRGKAASSSINVLAAPEKDSQRHRRLAEQWEEVLAEARSIPGFESFMRPRSAEELKRSATDGPIVLINTHSTRCDALIIFPQCDDIAHLPLTNLSLDKASAFREQLYSSSAHRGEIDRGFSRVKKAHEPDDPFKSMLAALWTTIVDPVLNALACTREVAIDELPHVTWCATGALAFLPLHAAGPYNGLSPNAYDLAISSYTPTLSALLPSVSTTSTSDAGILAVGQQDRQGFPPLPFTTRELAAIETHAKFIPYHRLDGGKATVNTVLDSMHGHGWVHLACHASQDPHDPAQSAFHLHNGDLTLEAITKRQFKNKGLAFLSACQTAAGDDNLPDEAVHLAAGMLMAGYPSVIATMWPMRDADGPEVAGRVYAELLKDGKADHRGAARALHKAVAGLREKLGEGPERWRWVPFIHIGV